MRIAVKFGLQKNYQAVPNIIPFTGRPKCRNTKIYTYPTSYLAKVLPKVFYENAALIYVSRGCSKQHPLANCDGK